MTTFLINTGTTTIGASTANNYVVVDGGVLDINAGVTVSGVIDVNSDSNFAEVTVSSVATVDNSIVVSGGTEFIDGTSLEASLDGGTQWVVGGGKASNTVAQDGGTQNIFGGDAFFTTIANGGIQNVFVGTGTEFDAEFTTVDGGGTQNVLDGSAYRTDLEGGVQIVSASGHGGFASGTIIEGGGVAEFIAGGESEGAEVIDGEELVEANGLALEDAVEHGGLVDVFGLGLVEDENLFGEELVESQGIDFESFVQSGGLLQRVPVMMVHSPNV